MTSCSPPTRRVRRSTRWNWARPPGAAAPGAKDVAGIDQKIAALLGTDAAAIAVTDLAVHPKTKNAFIAVMRGQGADAKPALMRVDGDGKLEPVALDTLEAHQRGAAERAGRDHHGAAESARRLDHRHGTS